MFHIAYYLRIMLVMMTLMLLMVMPVLADAPPAAPMPATVPPSLPVGTAPYGPAALIDCPPCEFCDMYAINPHGPRVAAPQLQGPTSSYTPTYIPAHTAPAAPMQGAVAQHAPGTYAVGGYVSNQPMPAGPNPSLGEVWMRHGGARLQYDALRGPIQMNTNGRPLKDPALVHAPPLYPSPQVVRVRAPKPKATTTKKVTPAPAVVKNNASPKPVAKPVLSPAPSKPAPQALAKPKTPATPPAQAKANMAVTSSPQASPSPAPVQAIPRTANPSLMQDYGPEGISRPAGSVASPYDGPAQAVGS